MKRQIIGDVERFIERRQALERRDAMAAGLAARTRELRAWQAARLARTYADLRRDPRCAPATEFFLADLYGAHDFGARDRQFDRAWQFFKRLLPAAPLRALRRALELDVLTRELDHSMVLALAGVPIDAPTYSRAWRVVGRREARELQIALVTDAGLDLEQAVRHPWSGALLRATHGPAHAAGFAELQGFLERGFHAFRTLPSAARFLATIRVRETEFMDAQFAAAASDAAGGAAP